MVRWGLRALLLALLLIAVGWQSNAHVVFEVFRVASAGLLAVAFALLLVGYVLTPQPPEA